MGLGLITFAIIAFLFTVETLGKPKPKPKSTRVVRKKRYKVYEE